MDSGRTRRYVGEDRATKTRPPMLRSPTAMLIGGLRARCRPIAAQSARRRSANVGRGGRVGRQLFRRRHRTSTNGASTLAPGCAYHSWVGDVKALLTIGRGVAAWKPKK